MSRTDWWQQSLTPPSVYEVTIRLGVIPEADHAQAQAEMKDPTTGILLAQWSAPHSTVHGLGRLIDEAVRKALHWIDAEVEPF